MGTVVITEPITSGLVLLKTSIGDISLELWSKECPKACRNFIQLSLEGFYDNLLIHRVLPSFIAQTGDPTGTGKGGESIYDEGGFGDEFNQRLKFNRRGLVGMANMDGRRDSNLSQFFFTLGPTPELQNRNTLFARVAAGDTLFNLLKLNEIELDESGERPVYPPVIKSVVVIDNPFTDIVPRITGKERREQERNRVERREERRKKKESGGRRAVKNKSLLSFGEEAELEESTPSSVTKKFTSSHDVAEENSRFRKEVIDDRGVSVHVPKEFDLKDSAPTQSTSKPLPSLQKTESSKLFLALAEKSKSSTATINPNDKLKASIAKVQSEILLMSKKSRRPSSSSSSDSDTPSNKKPKKPKRVGPSLLQLEREKYSSSKIIKGKKGRKDDDLSEVLEGFRKRILEAKEVEVDVKEVAEGGEERPKWMDEDDDDEDGDGGDWLGHKLVFRKDATLDRHKIDEYSTYDPLAKNSLSLDELKTKADNSVRKYSGENESGRGGRGRRDDRGRGGGRGGGGFNRERDNDRGDKDRGSSSSWKKDRIDILA